jgi:hypothetical protein
MNIASGLVTRKMAISNNSLRVFNPNLTTHC